MDILVGYTGFVGSNIYAKKKFDYVFNSKNIEEAYGLNPDLLVYAGLRAEKYLANNFPEKDWELIEQAKENIQKINPRKLVLISTVDVYKEPINVDENSLIEKEGLHAYGKNRYLLEAWVREEYPDALIIRLPGLFGENIKKNFIYDYIHKIPFMLNSAKMNELVEKKSELSDYYEPQENGFYKVKSISKMEKRELKEIFRELGFSAVNFTDSRNVYQFYPLNRLWDDIEVALREEIKLLNIATEPISIYELYNYLEGNNFENEIITQPVIYDYKTIHDLCFGGRNGYIMMKEQVLEEIRNFVESESQLVWN